MNLILTPKEYARMPYSETEVPRARTYGEIIGLLEGYGITAYSWTKLGGEDRLSFPLPSSSGRNLVVRLTVPRILVEKESRKGTSQEYKEATSWRLFWWYLKARLEASYYRLSSLEEEFLYQITDERTGTRLGDRVMRAIRDEGLDKVLLEDKSDESRRTIEVPYTVKEEGS